MPKALETEALSKRFGGLVAVDNVSLAVRQGDVHCVIGPNGAGKTTLLNLLSGALPPSAGRIRFGDQDIAGLPPHRIAQLGIGRSFQRTNIFPEFSAYENCRLGAQARMASSMRFFRPAERDDGVRERAERALALTGLTPRRDTRASVLSHGEQRQLEIGVMLATEPSLLLLDEPMAGMSADETARMVDLLRRLKEGHTLILIEHDMDAVFALADIITVMVNGAVLASGTPQEIRASQAVQDAYLGGDDLA
ncbi:MAG: ABC transporter ATP-binding protein [Alphaproteobacteria bacterium]|nr:ABC transporter ATP-binding protein [Alphaproteobacteria bacterium]